MFLRKEIPASTAPRGRLFSESLHNSVAITWTDFMHDRHLRRVVESVSEAMRYFRATLPRRIMLCSIFHAYYHNQKLNVKKSCDETGLDRTNFQKVLKEAKLAGWLDKNYMPTEDFIRDYEDAVIKASENNAFQRMVAVAASALLLKGYSKKV